MLFRSTVKENNRQIYNSEGAAGYLIGASNGCEYVRLLLNPGGVIEKHSLQFPVTFFVLKGNPAVIIGGAEINVSCGDLIEAEAGIERGWKNGSIAEAEVLVIKHLQI